MKWTLSEIAREVQGQIVGDGNLEIQGIASIEDAAKGEITFVASQKYVKEFSKSKASAFIIPEDLEAPANKSLIRTKNPYFTFLQTILLFHPPKPLMDKGIHPTAIIGEGTELGEDLAIGPYVVIGSKCRIGDGTVLMPGVVIDNNVTIGESCTIHANVSLIRGVSIGNRVVIHNGCVIGSDGFGFTPEGGKFHKIPQVGTVIIEDDVEIGANTTIDRATLKETRIKKGAKLDNLIMVGHNCMVGENTIMAGQAGLSGSTIIGNNVLIGGQVGFAGHTTVGDNAIVGAQSGITKDIPEGIMFSGSPGRPHVQELRMEAALVQLPNFMKEMKDLKKRVEKLEQERGEKC
jgi:UDP-3-O-[3-hydroxymyristoyl] glucosamine N-acyltransferase